MKDKKQLKTINLIIVGMLVFLVISTSLLFAYTYTLSNRAASLETRLETMENLAQYDNIVFSSDDAYVQRRLKTGESAGTPVYTNTSDINYGDSEWLIIGNDEDHEEYARIFLKFPLSSILDFEDIVSVKLFLYKSTRHWTTWTGVANIEARTVNNDFWTEDTITWNNQPRYTTLLDVIPVEHESYQWYSWDVTPLILREYTSRDEYASICLKAQDVQKKGDYYKETIYSSESGFHPYLFVEYEG
ncbi:MAG: DNRLRE domain-containing protein [Candidatus Bathyarchaeota archaeon]|nr:DNRLRE domain-containing protein [Candidatus Bathyarchaeota archaeon]MDH5779667.1 DNRLRE domain-containing protein [Candidatus Bathyarchaeota archaeon]